MKHYTPFEWTLIAVANAFGLDQKTYSTRLLWAYEHITELEDMVQDAKEKPMFVAACIAVRDAQMGMPSGFPVGLDSNASGIQLLSVLTRCEVGMRNTGVLNTGEKPNIYKKLTEVIGANVPLKHAKNSLMTSMYASSAEPKKAFGEGALLAKFYKAVDVVCPRANIVKNLFLNMWQPFATSHDWTMPTGHQVHKRVWATKDTKVKIANVGHQMTFRHTINVGTEKGVSLAADITHSSDAMVVDEMSARCSYNQNHFEEALEKLLPYADSLTDRTEFVALSYLDNMDLDDLDSYSDNYLARMYELVQRSMEYKPFDLLIVHDEFKCLANNVERMRSTYNRILWDMYHSNVLFDIIEQICGHRYENGEFDQTVADAILESEYAIS